MGHSSSQDGETLFLWTVAQGLQNLATAGYNAIPNAMNNRGEIVGSFYPPSEEAHAFLWTPGIGLQDLGTAGYYSQAESINDLGQVVGLTQTAGTERSHGFLWTETAGMKLLNDPLWPNEDSWPYSINIRGTIVGICNTPENAITYPTMWTPNGSGLNRVLIRDLQHPDLDYILVTKINDHGAMAGVDVSRFEAVLVTPVPDVSSVISLLLAE
jgi:probable HAF family extracellular repeat protein